MKWGNWIIGACCTLFVSVVVIPTDLYDGVWKLLIGKDAAAWVQAVGTILALGVAIGVGIWQTHISRQIALDQAKSTKLDELQRGLNLIDLAIGYGEALVAEFERWDRVGARKRVSRVESDVWISSLQALPGPDFPAASGALAAHKLRAACDRYCGRRSELVDAMGNKAATIAHEDPLVQLYSDSMVLDRKEIANQLTVLRNEARQTADRMRRLLATGVLGMPNR